MFFEIKSTQDDLFTQSWLLSNHLWLNCDSGWQEYNVGSKVYIKGYVDNFVIDKNFITSIVQDPTPKYQGNYFAVIDTGDSIILTHDIHRSTPLAIDTNLITNLEISKLEKIWGDCYLTINQTQTITKTYFNPYGIIDNTKISRDQAIRRLHELLNTKIENFVKHNVLPLKIFLSGGIDTTLIYSYIKKFTDNFEICNYEHIDFTKFWCNKRHLLDQYWGYQQIHLWKDSCILATGSNGDANFLREAESINMILMHYGVNILDVIDSNHYTYPHLTNDEHRRVYAKQKNDVKLNELVKNYDQTAKQILNMNLNDHQYWHLDQTLTFTPFKDLEITKIMLQLEKEDQIDQFLNAGISKELIELNDPNLLEYIDDQKNKNSQQKLWKLYNILMR